MPDSQEMHVLIKTLGGPLAEFDVPVYHATVETVKRRIANLTHIPIGGQRLALASNPRQQLFDNDFLTPPPSELAALAEDSRSVMVVELFLVLYDWRVVMEAALRREVVRGTYRALVYELPGGQLEFYYDKERPRVGDPATQEVRGARLEAPHGQLCARLEVTRLGNVFVKVPSDTATRHFRTQLGPLLHVDPELPDAWPNLCHALEQEAGTACQAPGPVGMRWLRMLYRYPWPRGWLRVNEVEAFDAWAAELGTEDR